MKYYGDKENLGDAKVKSSICTQPNAFERQMCDSEITADRAPLQK